LGVILFEINEVLVKKLENGSKRFFERVVQVESSTQVGNLFLRMGGADP